MSDQVERGTVRDMVHTIAYRAGVLERILQEPVYGSLEVRTDELAHVQLLQRQIDDLRRYLDLPSAEQERQWIPVTEALPNNAGHDWVLGQIRETDSGYLWIPKVVEYRESSNDWFEDSIGWLKKNPDHAFEVIAWMPLPEEWRGE